MNRTTVLARLPKPFLHLAAWFAILPLLASCATSMPSSTVIGGTTADSALVPYFLVPTRCTDGQGPDCTKLRLDDPHLTTTTPAVGSLYSCTGPNPSAPGSTTALITWINDAAGTWNLLRKPFLPTLGSGGAPGTITVNEANGTRTIQANGLPVDAKLGNWPMTQYPALTAIDRNPGTPAARVVSFTLPLQPQVAATPSCVGMGAIGVTLNGVVLFSAVDARGDDAVANEIVDVYGGHPAMTQYHYHNVPERLDGERGADGHAGIVGYMLDGFALYGYTGVGGVEITNADLDVCHGHTHGVLGYHYHATMEYPYTMGCYRGTPR